MWYFDCVVFWRRDAGKEEAAGKSLDHIGTERIREKHEQKDGARDVLIGPEGDGLSFFGVAVFDPDQEPIRRTDFILSEQHSDTVG